MPKRSRDIAPWPILLFLLAGWARAESVADTKFSAARGYYDSPFTLHISTATPGASIRYTLDGSLPSESHGVLAGNAVSVPISTTTCVRAVAFKAGLEPTNVDTQTYIFLDHVLQQPNNAQGIPSGPKIYPNGYGWGPTAMKQSVVNDYLARMKNDLKALPVLSLVLPLNDMFGSGGVMDYPDGVGLEKACSVEFFTADGKEVFQIDAGVELAGNHGRLFPKKQMTLHFRGIYGAKKLEFPLFHDSPARKFDMLRLQEVWEGTWLYWEKFADDLQGRMSNMQQHARIAHVYINGVYWGFYYVSERANSAFGEEYFGGDEEQWQRVDAAIWQELSNLSNLGDHANYTHAKSLLQVREYADYMLLSMYLYHYFYDSQSLGIRNLSNGNGLLFFPWDYDVAFGLGEAANLTGAAGHAGILTKLKENPDFRMLFADRIRKHFLDGGALTPASVMQAFQRRANEMDYAAGPDWARWSFLQHNKSRDSFLARRAYMEDSFIPQRTAEVLQQLRDAGLYPALDAPVFNKYGGAVASGFNLQMTRATGDLVYTTHGADPRVEVSGAVASGATVVSGNKTISIGSTVHVKARVKSGSTWSALTEAIFTVNQDLAKLKLTEIMYHPVDGGSGTNLIDGSEYEFIELKNTGSTALDLTGLAFTQGITFAFHEPFLLPAGKFCVLARNRVRFAERYPGVLVHGGYAGTLDNAGERITLSRPDGTAVLSVEYDDKTPWPFGTDGSGFSLVPIHPNPSALQDDPLQWRNSAKVGGSPGADDPAPPALLPVIVNEVLTHTDLPMKDSIELFNPNATAASVGGWYLTDDHLTPQKFRLPAGTSIPAKGHLVFNEDHFNPTPGVGSSFALSSLGEEVYLFSADSNGNLTGYSHGIAFEASANGVSFGRYVISTGAEHFPAQKAITLGSANAGPKVGPLVITEIHYNPAIGGDEFVELKNITASAVKLYDPAHPANTWRLSGVDFNFPGGAELAAGGICLVVPIDPASFRTKYSVPASVQIFGPYLGKLDNGGERVRLRRPDGPTLDKDNVLVVPLIVVDEVEYGDAAPWPAEPDGTGPALERIDPGAYGNDPINWRKSAASGGTPGKIPSANQPPVLSSWPWADPNPVTMGP